MNEKKKLKGKVSEVVEELKKFQEELDGDPLPQADIQAWCGHMNFIVRELIENIAIEFDKFRDLEFPEGEDIVKDLSEDDRKDFGGFYI